jgi:hypothetical protein
MTPMKNNGSRPRGQKLHLMAHTGRPESTELSGAEYALRASAFNDGVLLSCELLRTRSAILGRKSLPTSSEQLSRAFAHLAARVIRHYPRILRHLLTAEFVAGLVNSLLAEWRWNYPSELTESDWEKLTKRLRDSSRARWRSTPVRTASGQEYQPQARALEDGRKLAARLCEATKAIPDERTDREQWLEVLERFTHELVDEAIAAVATYPSQLRCWLTTELLGGFLAALLPPDPPAVTRANVPPRETGPRNADDA